MYIYQILRFKYIYIYIILLIFISLNTKIDLKIYLIRLIIYYK
jgi:hypothetical protein